ncbi:alpha/beta hydrolase-fold protein [Actinoplanes sp. NBRC 101535]|uniref:alpha/beta hydrolase n=1 Tax=Actinoplanes sp. NBRC 101535 TaxID=3032196 RepID=UPI002557C1D7|nr:alpha/beta hydrolase-fold protein [Actinoplanes sp. NBRC 101535]
MRGVGGPAAGRWRATRLPGLTVRIWSPPTRTDRMLVAHDGPEYHRRGGLGRWAATAIAAGRVAPFHLALLPPGDRDEWYSASPGYARLLTTEILPRLSPGRAVVGAGVSLGALAMLHAQRRHPARFAGLFLQSGSYFQARLDRQESGFRYFRRITGFTTRVRHATRGPAVPAVLTCGAAEENLANNRAMADALRRQGYPATLAATGGAHDWESWRDALGPHLTPLLHRIWPV